MISKIKSADNIDNIKKAADILKKGGIIVHPTDTIYGFAANALMINSVKIIDGIKNRKPGDTYIILVKDIEMAQKHSIIFDQAALRLAKRLWPGPLTLVLPIDNDSPLVHLVQNNSIALRISSNHFVKKLFTFIDFPIISTSVNKSGKPPINNAQKIENVFSKYIDMIIDSGTTVVSKPSTIVSVQNNSIITLRKGAVKESEIYGD